MEKYKWMEEKTKKDGDRKSTWLAARSLQNKYM